MDENLINVNQLRPFPRFLCTVGILPTSFKMSLTYEEQMMEIIKFIRDEIIPKINQNALATKELQEKFVELVNYVDTYFDNLDLQEEVNNKLDDMAESGELIEIIAQYLQLGTILTFETVNDMIASESLVSGSVVRTLGRTSFNDLKGGLYKIVTIMSHVPDGINTISLGHDDLYAQLIYENKIQVIDTLQNLKSATNITKYDYYKTLGYNSINDNGNGFYYIVDTLEDGESANNGNIVALQNGLYAKLIVDDIINVKQFGAVGDNTADDTAALQNAINFSVANNYKKIFIPIGRYKITSTLSTPQAFNQPIISGENTKETIFDFSTSTTDCLKIKGGSGTLAKSYLENITFYGNTSQETSCVNLEDVCGYDLINCIFDNCYRGVLFHNANGFTEFCIIKSSRFLSSCKRAIEYLRSSGTESFHGSGLLDCQINQANNETEYKIIINNNCLVYNAPLEFACWKANPAMPLINNLSVTGNLKQSFYGNMKLEIGNTSNQYILKENDGNVFYCGDILILGSSAILNNIKFCEKYQLNANKSVSLQRKQWKETITVTQNSQNILFVEGLECYIVQMRIFTDRYDYQYTLLVNGKRVSSGLSITQLANAEGFNQAGYGAPTFDNDGNNLRINNSHYAEHNVIVDMTVTPLRASL